VRTVNCQEWTTEIVEAARSGGVHSPYLTAHLAGCANCREQWEEQVALSAGLAQLRDAVAPLRSSEFSRARLMNEYARVYARTSLPRRFGWMFAAAAAALVLLAVTLSWRAVTPAGPAASQSAARVQDRGTAGDEFEIISGETGFTAVPYAAPLAKGEFVRVVRTELYAAALDRMGVSVPVTNGEFPADVIVGEDGLPRAVRVLGQY
jgi:predicted anti-sigma-YlaC factor YlaD